MTRRPKLAIFLHSSNEMFGADRVLLQVVESMMLEGSFSPEVWLPDDVNEAEESIERHLRDLGVRVYVEPLPILRRRYLKPTGIPALGIRAIRLWTRLIAARPDVVYCATSAVLLAAPIARLAGCRNVILHIQEIWSKKEGPILGALAASCSSAIAISEASRQSLKGGVRRRSRTIYNAVPDVDNSQTQAQPHGDRTIEFLVASRWNSWKGHQTLFDAWDRLEDPPGHLTVIGSPPEVGLGVDVPAMVASMRHPDSVTVIGQVADITPYVDACSFLIVPSDNPEPFGLVAIEAFARHRAVIASAAGGILEIVTDGRDGLLFPLKDVDALSAILGTVTLARASAMGEEARVAFRSRFSLERFQREFRSYWSAVSTQI